MPTCPVCGSGNLEPDVRDSLKWNCQNKDCRWVIVALTRRDPPRGDF
jgi:hypothetical protein